MHLQHPLKEPVSRLFILGDLSFNQIERLGHSPGEIHESVRRVPPVQGFIAAIHPGGMEQPRSAHTPGHLLGALNKHTFYCTPTMEGIRDWSGKKTA